MVFEKRPISDIICPREFFMNKTDQDVKENNNSSLGAGRSGTNSWGSYKVHIFLPQQLFSPDSILSLLSPLKKNKQTYIHKQQSTFSREKRKIYDFKEEFKKMYFNSSDIKSPFNLRKIEDNLYSIISSFPTVAKRRFKLETKNIEEIKNNNISSIGQKEEVTFPKKTKTNFLDKYDESIIRVGYDFKASPQYILNEFQTNPYYLNKDIVKSITGMFLALIESYIVDYSNIDDQPRKSVKKNFISLCNLNKFLKTNKMFEGDLTGELSKLVIPVDTSDTPFYDFNQSTLIYPSAHNTSKALREMDTNAVGIFIHKNSLVFFQKRNECITSTNNWSAIGDLNGFSNEDIILQTLDSTNDINPNGALIEDFDTIPPLSFMPDRLYQGINKEEAEEFKEYKIEINFINKTFYIPKGMRFLKSNLFETNFDNIKYFDSASDKTFSNQDELTKYFQDKENFYSMSLIGAQDDKNFDFEIWDDMILPIILYTPFSYKVFQTHKEFKMFLLNQFHINENHGKFHIPDGLSNITGAKIDTNLKQYFYTIFN
jgi:hypothetical protein